jgi:hypothetical protein
LEFGGSCHALGEWEESVTKTRHLRTLAAAVGMLGAVGLLALMLVMIEAGPAEAAFPGENGFIAYSSEPMGGPSEVFRIKPDGTRAKALTRGEVDRYAENPFGPPTARR